MTVVKIILYILGAEVNPINTIIILFNIYHNFDLLEKYSYQFGDFPYSAYIILFMCKLLFLEKTVPLYLAKPYSIDNLYPKIILIIYKKQKRNLTVCVNSHNAT